MMCCRRRKTSREPTLAKPSSSERSWRSSAENCRKRTIDSRCAFCWVHAILQMLSGVRVKTKLYKIMKRSPRKNGIRSVVKFCGNSRTISIRRIIRKLWLSILSLTNCKFLYVNASPSTNALAVSKQSSSH